MARGGENGIQEEGFKMAASRPGRALGSHEIVSGSLQLVTGWDLRFVPWTKYGGWPLEDLRW